MTHEHHHHHPGCTCGHPHEPIHVSDRAQNMVLTGREEAILRTIGGACCLPVARLIATKSDEEEVVIDCLSPVYLYDVGDTMEEVKEIGALLKGLEEKELLTLDYDRPIEGYDYALYTQSDLYAYFVRTIQEARGREGFLCDTPEIELGSMALTELGGQVCARE
jgi:hypothetical protein